MIKRIVGIVTGLLLLAGCSHEENVFEQQGNAEGLKTFTSFTATFDDVAGTRAYLSDTSSGGKRRVYWQEGDTISVYSDTDTELKTYRLTSLSADNVATFTGEEVMGTKFYAVYAPKTDYRVDEDNPNVIHFSRVGTSFINTEDRLLGIPMVATSTEGTLSFKQTMGIIHVAVGKIHRLDIVTFYGNNEETVGGSGYVNLSEAQPALILDDQISFEGWGYGFAPDPYDDAYADIYYAIPPTVFEKGFKIRISGGDAEDNFVMVEKRYDSRFEVKAATLYNFSLVDVTAELEANAANEIIVFADPIAKQICVENWDTNGDGELSYAEAATVKDIGRLFEANLESIDPNASKITRDMESFDEFQYFTGVTELPYRAFAMCLNLKSIILPKSIKSIGDYAFISCRSLAEIEIPDGVEGTGSRAFSSTALERLHLPASLVSFGSIDNCSTLNEITVDENNPVYDSRDNCNAIIETATNTLLYGCNGTQLPSTVTKIAAYALDGFAGFSCSNLDLSHVTSVGAYAFSGTNLSGTLQIPATLVEIGSSAFSGAFTSIAVDAGNPVYDSRYNCNALIETASNKLILGCGNTQIPADVSMIGDGAFRNITGLGDVVIPATVTSLGASAFMYSDIKSVVIPEGVTTIPTCCFADCEQLETVTLPSTIKEIGSYAFAGNIELKNINFPEGLTTIGDGAFMRHSLETIDLPSTQTSIGRDAFVYGEPVPTFIIVRATVPPTLGWGFPLPYTTYYVPAESIEAYQNAEGWSNYAYLIQAIPE